jgi:serine/threonine-protein kinase
MFFLLTARFVHEADTANKLLLAAMTKPAPPIRSILPELSPALAEIVDRALAFEQSDRFQSAHEMQQALRALGHGPLLGSAMPVMTAAPAVDMQARRQDPRGLTASAVARDSLPTRPRRRNLAPIVGSALAGVLLSGIIAVVALGGGEDPQPSAPATAASGEQTDPGAVPPDPGAVATSGPAVEPSEADAGARPQPGDTSASGALPPRPDLSAAPTASGTVPTPGAPEEEELVFEPVPETTPRPGATPASSRRPGPTKRDPLGQW